MESIFENILDKLFNDNPLSSRTESKSSSPKKPAVFTIDFTRKKLASDDTEKINKRLRKDKDVLINRLISKRYYGKGSDGHYSDDDATHNSLDEYSGETEVEIPSTAIADVKYDPKTQVCHVRYVNGNKWYRFINMSPKQFESFMNASSKGRYVQYVMRKKNRDSSFD